MSDFNEQISEYRKALLDLEQKTQSAYDKAVMTLSGGALGLTFTFLKDVVGQRQLNSPGWLLVAWICWGVSITMTLASFYTAGVALRTAVRQTDEKEIYLTLVGGTYNTVTKYLNFLSGSLFFIGVCSIVIFVTQNLR